MGPTRASSPCSVSELLVRREHLRFSTGRGFLRVEPVRRAAQLARPWPGSWQYGFALAEVAQASLWADTPDAQAAVEAAVEAAEAIDHPRVTAYAFAAAAMGAEFSRPARRAGAGCPRRAGRRGGTRLVGLRPRLTVGGQHDREQRRDSLGRASSTRVGSSWPRWEGHTRTWRGCRSTRPLPSSGAATGEARPSCSGSRSAPTRVRRATSRPDSWPPSWPSPRGGSTRPRTTSPGPTSCPPTRPPSWPGSSTRRRTLVRTGAGDARGAYAAAMTGLLLGRGAADHVRVAVPPRCTGARRPRGRGAGAWRGPRRAPRTSGRPRRSLPARGPGRFDDQPRVPAPGRRARRAVRRRGGSGSW